MKKASEDDTHFIEAYAVQWVCGMEVAYALSYHRYH
jgi:hypothetical protein